MSRVTRAVLRARSWCRRFWYLMWVNPHVDLLQSTTLDNMHVFYSNTHDLSLTQKYTEVKLVDIATGEIEFAWLPTRYTNWYERISVGMRARECVIVSRYKTKYQCLTFTHDLTLL